MGRYDYFAKKDVSGLGTAIRKSIYRKIDTLFERHFPSGGTNVLEIGTGMGYFAQLCRSRTGLKYRGYEPTENLFQARKAEGFDVVKKRVPPIDEPSASQDAVVVFHVLEHMDGAAQALSLLSEASRVLKSGGILLLISPSFLDYGPEFYNVDYTHTFVTTEMRVRQMVGDAGFAECRVDHHYGNFFSDFGRVPNTFCRAASRLLGLCLPRRWGRRDKVQKLGMLFAENIVLIARK